MKIDGLKITYNGKTVLDGVSLDLENNERIAVLGKSGAGKTSLIKALLNLVYFDGKLTNVPEFSVVFQEDRLVEELSCKDNIKLVCPNSCAEDVLEKVDLSSNVNDKVKTLSGGMKRRVSIARAMAKNCDMLIADEPFTGLDLSAKAQLSLAMDEFLKDKGLLLITHDLLQAYALCNRVIIIDNGKIALDKSTQDFPIEKAQEWFLKNS